MKLSLPGAAAVSFLSTIAGCSQSVEPVKAPATTRSTIQDVDIKAESEKMLKEQQERPDTWLREESNSKIPLEDRNVRISIISDIHKPNPTSQTEKISGNELDSEYLDTDEPRVQKLRWRSQ